MQRFALSLSEYTDAIREGWTEYELQRAILHDLPRRFHALAAAAQWAVLETAPPLTHTRWDALLAATAEHIAGLHGHAVPEWIDEPERFLAPTWVVPATHCIRMDAIAFAPAAFIRHGALPDPKDLDSRGGEVHDWLP